MRPCCHRGAKYCAQLLHYIKQCRARFGPNVLRCSARGATACNSKNYHIANAHSHNACGAPATQMRSTPEVNSAKCKLLML